MEHSRNGPTSHPLQGTVTAAQRAHALSHTHPGAVPGVPAHTRTSPVSGTPAGTRWQPGHVPSLRSLRRPALRRAGRPRAPPLPRCPPIRSRGAGGRAECPVGSAPPRAPLPGGDHAHSPPQEGITQGCLLLICIHLQAGYSPHFLTACHRQRPVPAVSPSCAGSAGRAAGRGAPGTVPVPASARSRRHRGDLPVRRFYSPAGFPRRRPPAALPSIYPRSPGQHSERRPRTPRSCLPRPDPGPAAPRSRAPPPRRGCQLWRRGWCCTGERRRPGSRSPPWPRREGALRAAGGSAGLFLAPLPRTEVTGRRARSERGERAARDVTGSPRAAAGALPGAVLGAARPGSCAGREPRELRAGEGAHRGGRASQGEAAASPRRRRSPLPSPSSPRELPGEPVPTCRAQAARPPGLRISSEDAGSSCPLPFLRFLSLSPPAPPPPRSRPAEIALSVKENNAPPGLPVPAAGPAAQPSPGLPRAGTTAALAHPQHVGPQEGRAWGRPGGAHRRPGGQAARRAAPGCAAAIRIYCNTRSPPAPRPSGAERRPRERPAPPGGRGYAGRGPPRVTGLAATAAAHGAARGQWGPAVPGAAGGARPGRGRRRVALPQQPPASGQKGAAGEIPSRPCFLEISHRPSAVVGNPARVFGAFAEAGPGPGPAPTHAPGPAAHTISELVKPERDAGNSVCIPEICHGCSESEA
ncbi:collagen alpha-1(I) chain-like [Ammospiza caudacuta]|uniref:collagen alpha-1(I) chain-like n=1 Tax=Ammospiza caudacuta TaxID=2857398 RepID=UPI0027394E69|nr:collagen alpha-1(I) chain-like [Ammospiza caudacuta]